MLELKIEFFSSEQGLVRINAFISSHNDSPHNELRGFFGNQVDRKAIQATTKNILGGGGNMAERAERERKWKFMNTTCSKTGTKWSKMCLFLHSCKYK